MTLAATPVPAEAVVEAIDEIGATHVVTVPDTHQRTLLDLLDRDETRPIIRAATEDDVVGICVGLWIAGHQPLGVIQQLGLFAAANSLRWARHDVGAPLPILAGLYGREVAMPVADNPGSAVRLCIPLLDALEIPWSLVEGPGDAHLVAQTLGSAFDDRAVRVVLLGAPTS
jgi:sulfopyruvate decarboxylase TPP-binding subunit